MTLLSTLTELSHEFGSTDYVRGGGGNTSVKEGDILWVKPSGATLAGISADSFIAMDRKKLAELYTMELPFEPTARELLVKNITVSAVKPKSTGRPSVEALLHDSLNAKYVVHTHPAIVNGMTCAAAGKHAFRRLFPDALWVEYTDPGYTLCIKVREEIRNYEHSKGFHPNVIFLENHGLLVGHNSPEDVKAVHSQIMRCLKKFYQQAGISTLLTVSISPSHEKVKAAEELLRKLLGQEQAAFIDFCGRFRFPEGPVSPDHIVYAGAYPFIGKPTAQAVGEFRHRCGIAPRIVAFDEGVLGVGTTPKGASLALDLARDGALVVQLSEAFGGIRYMSEKATRFIINWEAESYRQTQIEN